jgi:uncharacterized protein DUF262
MTALKKFLKVAPMEARTLSWWRTRRNRIDMDPPYQRRGRLWSSTDKAYLIDSIINGFDVPKFYIADFSSTDSPLNVKRLPYAIIDGKQRFEAIFDFFDGKVTLNDDFAYLENPDLSLGGLGYKDLVNNYSEIAEEFDNYNLSVVTVVTNSEDLINDLFVRLNRSKPLTGAEIRNAMTGHAPGVIRALAKHEFFSNCVSFQVQRGQDLNAAAKLLLFEFGGAPQETKKQSLDAFVLAANKDAALLELAGRRVETLLTALTTIFLPADRLLGSAGQVPVYYWLVRSIKESQFPLVRDFLIRFETARRANRQTALDSPKTDKIDRQLVEYDEFNRNTNDQASHLGRIEILLKRFKEFAKRGG